MGSWAARRREWEGIFSRCTLCTFGEFEPWEGIIYWKGKLRKKTKSARKSKPIHANISHNRPILCVPGTEKTGFSVCTIPGLPLHLTAFPADGDFFRNGKDQTPWGKWVEKFPLHVIGHRMYSSHLGGAKALSGDPGWISRHAADTDKSDARKQVTSFYKTKTNSRLLQTTK